MKMCASQFSRKSGAYNHIFHWTCQAGTVNFDIADFQGLHDRQQYLHRCRVECVNVLCFDNQGTDLFVSLLTLIDDEILDILRIVEVDGRVKAQDEELIDLSS